MKKRIVTLLFTGLLAMALAACGSGSTGNPGSSSTSDAGTTGSNTSSEAPAAQEASAAPEGDIIINYYNGSDAQGLIVDAQVEAFNALDNGITVVPHIIANDSYDDKIKVLASGNAEELDIMWLRGSGIVKQYVANNALADLSGYAANSGLDLAPIKDTTLMPVTEKDGTFYGMPTTGSAWMLFYNKDIFDAAGISYPENITWDEYADIAKQLTKEENGNKQWGGLLPDWTMNLGASSAGEYLTAESPMPYTTKYVEFLHRIYTDDKSHPGIATITTGSYDYNAVFETGTVAMMINGDWDFNLLSPDLNYGVAPLPVFSDIEKESTVGQASYLCVSSSSKKQEAAWTFIEFCTASEAGADIYVRSKSIPCYPTEKSLALYKQEVTVPGVEYRFSAKLNAEAGTEDYYNDINDAFKQEMKLYLLDEQSLEKSFESFYKLRQEAMD